MSSIAPPEQDVAQNLGLACRWAMKLGVHRCGQGRALGAEGRPGRVEGKSRGMELEREMGLRHSEA